MIEATTSVMDGLAGRFGIGNKNRVGSVSLHNNHRRRPAAQPGWRVRNAVLQHRLEELLVFEIHRDGTRGYRSMTLRALYNYALAAIATRPTHLKVGAKVGRESRILWAPVINTTTESWAGSGKRLRKETHGVDHITSFVDNVTSVRNSGRSVLPEGSSSLIKPLSIAGRSRAGTIGAAPEDEIEQAEKVETPLLGSPPAGVTYDVPLNQTGSGDGVRSAPSTGPITYRERLGGYLHPRDMRRLVTPFSASNEPEFIVRRHVILLNFDPLRAVVLRDRLLVLVPDGADSILESLANRIKGGMSEMEASVFGEDHNNHVDSQGTTGGNTTKANVYDGNAGGSETHDTSSKKSSGTTRSRRGKSEKKLKKSVENFEKSLSDDEMSDSEGGHTEIDPLNLDPFEDDEWGDLQGKAWIDLPFELQSLDAVLHTVSMMLTEEANELQEYCYEEIETLLESHKSISGEMGHDILRSVKKEISQMISRVQGFVRAINLVLDEDEDLALMNLSRLITHPERFIQPVPLNILHEESDEPELILEAYLQQSLSNTNALELLKNEVTGSEELINMKLDTVRNRLLYINTVVSLLTLAVGIGSFIGSIFGMNLVNGLEDSPTAWKSVVLGTIFGALVLIIVLWCIFDRAGTLPRMS